MSRFSCLNLWRERVPAFWGLDTATWNGSGGGSGRFWEGLRGQDMQGLVGEEVEEGQEEVLMETTLLFSLV